jgi:hypothetical protein
MKKKAKKAAGKKVVVTPWQGACSVSGCKRRYRAEGFCSMHWRRAHRPWQGKAPVPRVQLGRAALKYVTGILIKQGHRVEAAPGDPRGTTVVVDGRSRMRVMACQARGPEGWRFNIHRHGKLDESGTDKYAFAMKEGKGWNVVFAKGPMKRFVVTLSPRQLLRYEVHGVFKPGRVPKSTLELANKRGMKEK